MTKTPTEQAQIDSKSTAADNAKERREDTGRAFSGRPTTVRFPTDLQKRLAVAAEITGMSLSELMREGAEHIVAKYVGDDKAEIAATIEAAAKERAQRMRELYGLGDE